MYRREELEQFYLHTSRANRTASTSYRRNDYDCSRPNRTASLGSKLIKLPPVVQLVTKRIAPDSFD